MLLVQCTLSTTPTFIIPVTWYYISFVVFGLDRFFSLLGGGLLFIPFLSIYFYFHRCDCYFGPFQLRLLFQKGKKREKIQGHVKK